MVECPNCFSWTVAVPVKLDYKELFEEVGWDVVVQWLPLCHKICAKVASHYNVEKEDLMYDAYLAVARCKRNHDPTRTKFMTYVYRGIRNAASQRARDIVGCRAREQFFSDLLPDSDGSWDWASDRDVGCAADEEALPQLDFSVLTSRQQAIVMLRARGRTLKQLGDYMGLSRERIRQELVISGQRLRGEITEKKRKLRTDLVGKQALARARRFARRTPLKSKSADADIYARLRGKVNGRPIQLKNLFSGRNRRRRAVWLVDISLEFELCALTKVGDERFVAVAVRRAHMMGSDPRAHAPVRSGQPWSKSEVDLVRTAIEKVEGGQSIYSQVRALSKGPLNQSRSSEAIRSKINEMRKQR